VTLNAQQRTTIRQTVLAGSNVPRVNNVNFALSVETVVPTSVRFVDVPPALIEINSAWRGHQYFVVRDDIVIVDHSRKIVAVVPVGSGGASLGGGSRVSGGAGEMDLTTDQIRQIQIVLNERGFNIGRPDGRLGRRTVEALTAFQRKQGFQATGRIDAQTASALGVSNVSGGQSGGATAGQGGASSQSGKAQQAPAQQNQGANKPSTSGQAPKQGVGEAKPSTSGQSGASQAPAQHNEGSKGSSTSGQSGMPAQQNENEKK